MPILSNPKHELFAQELAQGKNVAAAYAAAGYAPSDSNCSRLNGNAKVKARVNELLAASAKKAGVTIDRIVKELAKIGFANASDYFTWGPNGVSIKPSSELTPDQLAVVAEVQETRSRGAGENTIKVKLSDKQSALEKLGRHLGMFKEKVEHSGPNGGPIETREVSARERISGRIAVLAAKLRKDEDPSGSDGSGGQSAGV